MSKYIFQNTTNINIYNDDDNNIMHGENKIESNNSTHLILLTVVECNPDINIDTYGITNVSHLNKCKFYYFYQNNHKDIDTIDIQNENVENTLKIVH